MAELLSFPGVIQSKKERLDFLTVLVRNAATGRVSTKREIVDRQLKEIASLAPQVGETPNNLKRILKLRKEGDTTRAISHPVVVVTTEQLLRDKLALLEDILAKAEGNPNQSLSPALKESYQKRIQELKIKLEPQALLLTSAD